MQAAFIPETVALFVVTVLASILVDLVLHRHHKEISAREAGLWSVFWILVAVAFGGYLRWRHGTEAASLYFAGYVLEKTLSVDNLMVFIAIFAYFKIAGVLQYRILYYGIIGAIIFRLIFVVAGGALMSHGGWANLLFAVAVAYSGWGMLRSGSSGGDDDYADHRGVKLVSRFYATTPFLVGTRFFVSADEAVDAARSAGVPFTPSAARLATPALACLFVIQISDVLFSFDSVPTVIAVTQDPVLVYAAMIFAILGLRSLYFVLAALTRYLVHLEKAIIGLLFFIALKLGIHAANELAHLELPEPSPQQSLAVVGITLAVGVVASVVWPETAGEDSNG